MSIQTLYTVTATGNTWPCKASLKDWDFSWYRDEKVWRAKGVTAGAVAMFQQWARGAEWEGVELTVTEEPAPFNGPRYTLDQQIRNEREDRR